MLLGPKNRETNNGVVGTMYAFPPPPPIMAFLYITILPKELRVCVSKCLPYTPYNSIYQFIYILSSRLEYRCFRYDGLGLSDDRGDDVFMTSEPTLQLLLLAAL